MRETWAEFRAVTDPVAVWLEAHTAEDPAGFVVNAELYGAYLAQADAQGQLRLTATAFGLALKQLRPGLVKKQRTLGGKPQWGWQGLAVRTVSE